MSIEKRIGKKVEESFQNTESEKINTDYRAKLHQEFSKADVEPRRLREQILREPLVVPLDAQTTKKINQIETKLYEIMNDREIVTPSPLGIFHLNQYLTKTSPLKIAHVASRAVDVVADPTIELAAESYRRRIERRERGINIKLGASQICARLQKYSDETMTPVFKMFGTLDSDDGASDDFEQKKIITIAGEYANLFRSLNIKQRPRITVGNVKIGEKFLVEEVLDISADKKSEFLRKKIPPEFAGVLPPEIFNEPSFVSFIEDSGIFREVTVMRNISEAIKENNPDVDAGIQIDRTKGIGHYNGPCFAIDIGTTGIADGGSVDWVAKLTDNQKERTVVTGLGVQLLAKLSEDIHGESRYEAD